MSRSTVRIELVSAGVEEVLKSAGMVSTIAGIGRSMANAAGEGFESQASAGRRRAIGMVWAETPEARAREARDRRLTRSIDAGRR